MAVVAESTIRQDVFSKIFTLIDANKPTYTGHGSVTKTYTILSAFPDVESPAFPLIVINPADIDIQLLQHDASAPLYDIELRFDFYCLRQDSKKGIDAGRDSVTSTILGNAAAFQTDDGLLLKSEPIEDSSVGELEINRRMVHTGTSLVRMTKQ